MLSASEWMPNHNQSIFEEKAKLSKLMFDEKINIGLERSAFVSYNLLCIILSSFGNSFILYAAWKRAIRLNQVTVSLVQAIAITDLGITIFKIFPVFLMSAVDRWIFGTILCEVQFNLYKGLFLFSSSLICLLNLTKAITLAFPFRASTLARRHGYAAAGVAFIVIFGWEVFLKMHNDVTYFSIVLMHCTSFSTNSTIKALMGVSSALVLLILNVLIISTTCYILLKAYQLNKRNNRAMNLQGVSAVLLISALYLLSTLPHLMTTTHYTLELVREGWMLYFITTSVLLTNLNSVGNIFMYYISLQSFQRFLRSWVAELALCQQPVHLPQDIQLNIIIA